MPGRTIVFGLAGVLVAAAIAGRAGGAPPRPAVPALGASDSASRIVDRTFACSPMAFGGVGDLDVSVSQFIDYGAFQHQAHLTVSTGSSNPEDNLVFVRARAQIFAPGRTEPAGVFASSRRCAPARALLPLSAKGLAGPPTQWQKQLDCPVAGRVLVRVRSVLQSPATWRRLDRFFHGARQPVVEAKLAVRAQRTGKPIVYMEHDRNGEIKLWSSSGCS